MATFSKRMLGTASILQLTPSFFSYDHDYTMYVSDFVEPHSHDHNVLFHISSLEVPYFMKIACWSLHFSGILPLVTVSAWDTAPVVIAMAFVVCSMPESELSPNLPKRALF